MELFIVFLLDRVAVVTIDRSDRARMQAESLRIRMRSLTLNAHQAIGEQGSFFKRSTKC
jgi:hypothetical protein